ncbi:MAG: sodium:solute symporter [Bacteroidota bacterium]
MGIFNGIDLLVVALYLVFISWNGIHSARKKHTTDDFFLASRSLTWPMVGLSLFASNISSSTLIALAGSGYQTGISVFNYEWLGTVMLIFFALFIVPFYLKQRLFTMPEFLANRFDHRVKNYFSVLSIVGSIFIDIAGALYAGAVLFKLMMPDSDLTYAIVSLAIIAGLYTFAGGLKAVVATDITQSVLLLIGASFIAFFAFQRTGGMEPLSTQIDPSFFSLIQPTSDTFIPWPTLLVSLPILGFYYMCTNQHMVQRVLGAKDISHARLGALFAGGLKLPLLFIMVMPGTFALLLYPGLSNSNEVFPLLMFDLLPAGLLGLVFTGFIAALMSSIDSALTASSTILTMDIYKAWKPQSSEEKLVRVGRIFILLIVVFASLWAPFIDQFPTLWDYLQGALSYLVPPIVSCFIFGLFWRRATSRGALAGLISGNALGIAFILNNIFEFAPQLHYLYAATILFIVGCTSLVIVSLMEGKKDINLKWTYFFNIQNNKKLLALDARSQWATATLSVLIIVMLWLFW